MAAPPPAAPAAPPPAAPGAPAPAAAAPAPAAAVPAAAAPPPPCPYTTIPGYVTLKLPTRQRRDEIIRFQMKNPTPDRVTFDVGGTQVNRFVVMPQQGFIEPFAISAEVELQPLKIDKGAMKSYVDKFLIKIAPSPTDQDAEALWKGPAAPKNPAILPMDIKIPD